MPSSDASARVSATELLDQLVADYVRAVESGNPPDREQLLVAHPELADDLRDFFHHRDRMEKLLDPLRSAAARALHIRCPHCHNAIELVDHAQVTDLSCPSCGSSFSLVATGSTGRFPGGMQRIGQFQLVEQVGVGQFGSVWKARDLTLERTVAIKIPRNGQLSEAEAEMFLRDARLSAQLHHPNIVSVHEVGKQHDTIYIVSDFIQGASLKEWNAVKRLSPEEAARLCMKVATALHHAHEAGVVHRDLKPGNVMMDLTGEPHLVDFGLAKRDSGEITMTLEGQILGTPAYMSPEQANGKGHDVDRRADIFSLGVILFELLTGELPFRGDKQMLIVQIVSDDPPSPRRMNARVPRDLANVCLKCLEKQPQDRYQSARELADDCRRYLAGEPVQARPLPRPVRAFRWSRRNPWLAGLWATCALLLVGLAVVASIGYLRTQMALALANERADTIERNLYFAKMRTAGQASINPNGLAEVQRLLQPWKPENSRVDLRGWEWHYLDSLLHEDLATRHGHSGEVTALAFSPDGKWLASAGYDQSVRIWASDGTAQHVLTDHRGPVHDLAWNQDGSQLASAGEDGTVHIWDSEQGELVRTLQHDEPVATVAWSPAGDAVASACSNSSTVFIYDTSTWEVQRRLDLSLDAVHWLRWNPQHSQLAVAPQHGQIVVVDASTGQEVTRFGHAYHSLPRLQWNHDGTRIAYSYPFHDNLLHIWRADDADQIQIKASAGVSAVAWHPHAHELAMVDGDKMVQLRRVATDTELGQLRGHLSRVSAVCWHPRSERIATASTEGEIKIWNASPPRQFSSGAATIAWHPEGARYASRVGKSVVLCDAKSPLASPISLYDHAWDVAGVAWSPDGATLASISYEGQLQLWDAASRTSRQSVRTRLTWTGSRFPRLLAWSPDCRRLAMPHDDRDVQILNTATGEVEHVLPAGDAQLLSLAWSPDGKLLAGGGRDGTVRLWDPQSGAEVARMGDLSLNDQINSISWHPDSSQLACATSDYGVLIWKLGETGWRYLLGHTIYVHSVAWSPDGERIASADESGSVRIWDARSEQMTFELHYPGGVPDVAWSPDGKSLAAAGWGGEKAVRIWTNAVDPPPALLW